jgi:hypothetical protein
MRNLLTVIAVVLTGWMSNAQAQSLTVDPESIVPLPDKFEMEPPASDVPPEIARFQGAWIGTWAEDIRHILVVERVRRDGHADVIFAHGDSAFYGMYREWWRSEATIAGGVLTISGEALKMPSLRTLQFAFDGSDRLFHTSTFKWGSVIAGSLARTDAARLAAGERPIEWPWPGERVSIPHLTVRTPDGARPIMLEATLYRPAGLVQRRSRSSLTDPTPAAISSGAGRTRSRRVGFATTDLPCWR